ncbi:large ribosomal subunit protein bL9m [Phymastichus coffea]|uniref:large ribosomal subunit protein bL9m n=1 Tax=Phymastichus coffea TaxID=108790 RepID=UPI00273CAC0A|nr:large ribosomal subunit protein bL9m [Phymastichus coffea]
MLGFWKSSASTVCTVVKSLLNNSLSPFNQQTRTTVILKRKFPVLLHKKGKQPHKMKNRQFIYEVVDNTSLHSPKPIDIILTEYVEGYGEKGDKLSLKPNKAYNEFLLPGLAIYASPENIEKYLVTKKTTQSYSSLQAPLTIKALEKCCVFVTMSIENPWVIEKWHIKTSMMHSGFEATNESITLPEKEISGPNLDYEGKEFYVTVTINKTEQVKVRCRLRHVSLDVSKQLEKAPDWWKIPAKAIFPEDQEVLDSIPRPQFEQSVKKS